MKNPRRFHAGSMIRWLRRLWTFTASVMLCPCAGAFGAADPNQGWIEVRSPHFVVSSNAGEKEARRIAESDRGKEISWVELRRR
jgi:hypothetical protein